MSWTPKLRRGALGRLWYVLRLPRRPVNLAALVRMWWYDLAVHVPFGDGERCQDCGRGYVLWHAPDDLYAEAHGSLFGLLCPACFSRQAEAKGIIVRFEAAVFRRTAGVLDPSPRG